jgi:CHAT domain-containing protein
MSQKLFNSKIIIGAMLFFLLFSITTKAQEIKLPSGKSITIRNSYTKSFVFNIEAKKRQVISFGIKQNGMDISAKLFNPTNVLLAESDQPFSEQEIERIFVAANESGNYRLEITSKFPDEKGSINITLNELREALPEDYKRAEAEKLFSQAQTLRTTGSTADRKQSREIYEKSLAIWREIGDKTGEIRTLVVLSYLNRILSNYQKSQELSEQVLQFPDLDEYDFYKADALYQIGQSRFVQGQIDEAVKSVKKALLQVSSASAQQANMYTALGNYYQTIYEFELAKTSFDDAFRNISEFPDIYNEAQANHIIGLLYITLKEFDSAILSFKRAADLREKFGNRRGMANSLSLLGSSYFYSKNFSEAIEILQKTLPISQELGDIETQSDILVFLAVSYRDSGNPLKAVELLNQSLSLFPDKSSVNLNTTYITLGYTQTQLNNFGVARTAFERAFVGYRKLGDVDGETRTLYQFAKLELAENNLDAAKIKVENSLEKHEFAQSKYNNVPSLSTLLEFRRGYFDLYIDILMRLDEQRPNEGFALKALQISEGARMRTLIWQYREAIKDTPQSVDYQLLTQIQKNQQQLGGQFSLLAKAQSKPGESTDIANIEKTIAKLNKQDESLKAQLRQSNPNVGNLASPPPLSLAEMQAELDVDTVLVEYSLGEQNSYLWIVGKNSFQSFKLSKRGEIEAQAKNYYQSLNEPIEAQSSRQSDKKSNAKKIIVKDVNEEADKLSKLLLVEKYANLSAKRLVFVADGALNLVPFSSLTFVDLEKKILGEKFETVKLPSLTTLHVLRGRNTKLFAPNSLAVIADPVFSIGDERLAKGKKGKNKSIAAASDLAATLRDFNMTTLSRLPFSRTEAKEIAQNSPYNTSLNLDFKASRERLLNGEFDYFDILHFATHGFLNNQHPELSGLVLSLVDEKGNQQNGFLRTQDLFLLKIKPQMVVLSACQTGLGKQVENEGLVGLTRGFLANGTPRIVATLWKVDDAATADFMSRFYRAMLKENQVPSAALKTAQNEMRQIKRFSHPRFWAGFVLTGEWR